MFLNVPIPQFKVKGTQLLTSHSYKPRYMRLQAANPKKGGFGTPKPTTAKGKQGKKGFKKGQQKNNNGATKNTKQLRQDDRIQEEGNELGRQLYESVNQQEVVEPGMTEKDFQQQEMTKAIYSQDYSPLLETQAFNERVNQLAQETEQAQIENRNKPIEVPKSVSVADTISQMQSATVDNEEYKDVKGGLNSTVLLGVTVVLIIVYLLTFVFGDQIAAKFYKPSEELPPITPQVREQATEERDQFASLVKKNAANIKAKVGLVESLITLQEFKDAQPKIEELKSLMPNSPYPWRLSATTHVALKEYSKSYPDYEKFLQMTDSRDVFALEGYSQALIKGGQPEKAVQFMTQIRNDIAKLAETDPTLGYQSLTTRINIAKQEYDKRQEEGGTPSGYNKLDTSEKNDDNENSSGTTLSSKIVNNNFRDGDLDKEADENEFDEDDLMPREYKPMKARLQEVQLVLAKAYGKWKGHEADALKIYSNMISETPDDFRPYLCKGLLLKQMKKDAQAEMMFASAKIRTPKDARVMVQNIIKQNRDFGTL